MANISLRARRLHFIGFGHGAPAEEGGGTVKAQNEKMLASVAVATRGTVVPAQTVVDLMGESTIKTTNPVLVRCCGCCRWCGENVVEHSSS